MDAAKLRIILETPSLLSNETRYDPLVNALNGNLDYLKNTVLARKASSEDEPEDEGGDTPEPSPEPTPVTPE